MPGAGDRTAPLLPTDGSASPSPAHSVDASDESLRLVATVVVVVVGSSFQFGFGAAELNNVEKVVRDELESEEGAVSPDRWGLLVSGFSIGGLVGSLLASTFLQAYERKRVLLLTNALVFSSALLYMCGRAWGVLFAARVLIGPG